MELTNFTAARRPGSIVALQYDVPPAETRRLYDRALQTFVREAQLPGFRKGKAPAKMVEERYRDRILAEAEDDLVRDSIRAALEKEKIGREEILSAPRMEKNVSFSLEAPVRIEAEVEVFPAIEARDYTGVKLTRRAAEVPDEAIEAEIGQLAERNATLVPVERPAAVGDVAVCDFEGKTPEGVPIPKGAGKDVSIKIGDGRFLKEFESALEGMTIGESKEFQLTFPEDYSAEELRGKPAVFSLTLQALKERRLQPIDDDFAKDLEYENLAALRDRIAEWLKGRAETEIKQELEADLLENLRRTNPVEDLPATLVEDEVERRREGFERRLAEMRVPTEKFFEISGKSRTEHEEEIRRLATETIHTALILRAVARTENLSVSDEDLSRAIAGTALQNDLSPEVLAQRLAAEGRLGLIKFDLLKRKALQFILEKAEIEEKPSTLESTRPEAP